MSQDSHSLQVNGRPVVVRADARDSLLQVLHGELGLTGAKLGCGLEQCGSCKVLIDGTPRHSCALPIASVAGAVTTIEGLAAALPPVAGPPAAAIDSGAGAERRPDAPAEPSYERQRAFAQLYEHLAHRNAGQCGYCLPGIMVAATALLVNEVAVDRATVAAALSDHLCRCGAQPRILQGIVAAAAAFHGRSPGPDDRAILAPEPVPAPLHVAQLPTAVPAALPAPLQQNPALARWLTFGRAGEVRVRTGKVEIGQGIYSAFRLLVADELGVLPQRVTVQGADTQRAPNEWVTAGSMSVQSGGAALRQAMAQVRTRLVALAAERLGVAVEALQVSDGRIHAATTNRSVAYWELLQELPDDWLASDPVPERAPEDCTWTGRTLARADLARKLRGAPAFVHDLGVTLSGGGGDGGDLAQPEENAPLLHARIVRAPWSGAQFPQDGLAELLGGASGDAVTLVRDGDFCALLAASESAVIRAQARLCEQMRGPHDAEKAAALADPSAHLRANEQAQFLLDAAGAPTADPVPSVLEALERVDLEASYSRPYLLHGSIGPSAAMATLDATGLTVWSHSQGVEIVQRVVAQVLGMPRRNVRVIHTQGAGCYGHNGADDVALEAALVARAVPGQRILLKWTRADEHRFEPYGPAMYLSLAAHLDRANKCIRRFAHDVWSYTHVARPRPPARSANDAADGPGTSTLLAAQELAQPFAPTPAVPASGPHTGIHRNAVPKYQFERSRAVKRFCAPAPVRTSALRGLGAHGNVFAIESFMDEAAGELAVDPVALRLDHLADERARTVVQKVVAAAGGLRVAASADSSTTVRGRGLGFAQYKNQQTYAAVVVEVEVPEDAQVRVVRAWIAADAGRIVDADGLVNQLEGGLVQAASWTLYEAVQFSGASTASVDWESYPIMAFGAVPEISTELVSSARPSVGAGEATQGPTAGAIANAVFAATGLRIRHLPITPDRLRAEAAQ